MDPWALWSGLFGGLALFLLGLDFLTRALKALAGDRLRLVLERLTRSRVTAVITGALVTALVNSSSVTTVLLVGFVSAGLMSLAQSVGVVMGANIGSTFTAQLLAFDVGALALPMIALGFGASVLGRREAQRQAGLALLGLGLVFFGMQLMGAAMAPLRDWPPFVAWMARMQEPLLGLLAGALFTALVQSSAATLGIVLVLAGQGILTLDAAIALALGSNIGTCVTAGLAVLGKPREAVRVFLVHLLFNLAGALAWLPFIDDLAWLAAHLSTGQAGLPRTIANAHTLFNVLNTLALLAFTPQIARLVARLVPEPPGGVVDLARPRYLDDAVLTTPALALVAARRELVRLGELAGSMLQAIGPALLAGSEADVRRIVERQMVVERLHAAVVRFLAGLGAAVSDPVQSGEIVRLLQAGQNLLAVAELIGSSLVRLARLRLERGLAPPRDLARRVHALHQVLTRDFTATVAALADNDATLARSVRAAKHELHELARALTADAFREVAGPARERVAAFTGVMEALEVLTRIHRLCRKTARLVLDAQPPDIGATQPAAEPAATG